MSDWVRGAPLVATPEVVGSVSKNAKATIAGVSLRFPKLNDQVCVTVIGSEFELRKFQRDLDRAITKALRELKDGV